MRFSALAALGAGGTLAIEFSRAARHARHSHGADAIASAARGVCNGLGCTLLCGWRFGLSFAVLTIGAISALMAFICPVVEDVADRLPARRLGVFGTFLILCGFLLESVPHWLTLFDVAVK